MAEIEIFGRYQLGLHALHNLSSCLLHNFIIDIEDEDTDLLDDESDNEDDNDDGDDYGRDEDEAGVEKGNVIFRNL